MRELLRHDTAGAVERAALTQLETQAVLGTLLRRRPGLALRGVAERTCSPPYRGFLSLPVAG